MSRNQHVHPDFRGLLEAMSPGVPPLTPEERANFDDACGLHEAMQEATGGRATPAGTARLARAIQSAEPLVRLGQGEFEVRVTEDDVLSAKQREARKRRLLTRGMGEAFGISPDMEDCDE